MSTNQIHSLQNKYLKISAKEIGAELCSIISNSTDIEYMWDANPEVWSSYAPVLFPIIGELKDGTYYYNECQYRLPRHGIVRNNPKVRLTEKTETGLTFSLDYDEDSFLVYPFRFRFSVSYALDENRVIVQFKVENLDNVPLYFSVGGHPAFCCPRNTSENYEDYYLEFGQKETVSRWLLTDKGLLSGETKVVLTDSTILPLTHDLFREDALVFKDLKSRSVCLKSRKSPEVIIFDYSEFPYLGIWAKPQGNYVCIEPWLGVADSGHTSQKLENKEGIIRLEALDTFLCRFTIEVVE